MITEPFDLQKIFVVTLAGTTEIFTFLSIIFVSAISAYFRMPNYIAMIMYVVYALVMSQYIGGMYILVILLAGIVTFAGMSRVWK